MVGVDGLGRGGEDLVELLHDVVRRQPARRLPAVHRAARGVEAQAQLAGGLDLGGEQVAAALGEDVVVVAGGGAAGQRQLAEARRRGALTTSASMAAHTSYSATSHSNRVASWASPWVAHW